jgi:hypothetical protein
MSNQMDVIFVQILVIINNLFLLNRITILLMGVKLTRKAVAIIVSAK